MIRISQLKLPITHTRDDLKKKILKTLRISDSELLSWQIQKQSIDARKKPQLFYIYSVDVHVKNESSLKKKVKNGQVIFGKQQVKYSFSVSGTQPLMHRPVIIGTGPAGLFCGYMLALAGYRPVLLERGEDVDQRMKDVECFWNGGPLNPDSNVQFGEGGAGTFSDGKLNTLVNDKLGRNTKVLEIFHAHGAPQEIMYQSKPHIGTDILASVIRNMRHTICTHGGEVRFHSQVTDIRTSYSDNREQLTGLCVRDLHTGKEELLFTDIAVFAIGHSARDTFAMLMGHRLTMEPKSFAVGVRMEHPQSMINEDQYGEHYPDCLPAAPYKLAVNLENGRGVYTFCMCPGGYVVNASSEEHRLAVNGMSYSGRDGKNANSAVIVTVTPEDYGNGDALSGMEYQRRLEEAAYLAGNGKIPVQLFGDFCSNKVSDGPQEVLPQMKGEYAWSNVRSIFPEEIAQSLEEGIRSFGHKIHGYAREDAVLSGVESRTSSPVRILRDDTLQSNIRGIFPCGEGAGYAGGITSAAMDGLKVAENIAMVYRPFDTVSDD